MGFEIVQRREGDFHVVAPEGELDLATQCEFRSALQELILAGHVDLVVDLRQTSFVDSTGLGALISARRRTHAHNGSFAIICENPRLREMFRLTRLDLVFRVHETYDDWESSRKE